MAQTYKTVTTNLGRNAIQLALSQGKTITLTHMAVGDGKGTEIKPESIMTSLVGEVYRAQINTATVTAENQITVELIIPQSEGPFFIREVGAFMADGTLFAIGNTPLTEKTDMSSGSATDLIVRMSLRVTDADAINILVDPAQVLATREYADGILKKHDEKADCHVQLMTTHNEDIKAHKHIQNLIKSFLYPSAFVTLYEQSPPSGFYVRNGGLITNADTTVPKLWEALQKPENAWKCKTQAQWTALSNATPWSGIGGVPFFVVDMAGKTIRLPDTRGMYEEGAGFNNLEVGGVHGDASRRIEAAITNIVAVSTTAASGAFANSVGAPNPQGTNVSYLSTGTGFWSAQKFDSSLVTPVSVVNMPRGFGVLHCIYAG